MIPSVGKSGFSLVLVLMLFPLGFIDILALFLGLLPLLVAFGFGMNAVVIEDLGPVRAFRSGIDRALKGPEYWRTLPFTLVYFAAAIAFSTLTGLATDPLHSQFLKYGATTLINTVAGPIWATFLIVYYFDIRIRREGRSCRFPGGRREAA